MNKEEAQALRVLVAEVLATIRDKGDPVVPLTHVAMFIDSHDKETSHSHCVMQDWVSAMPLMMQSALITATRGPDAPYVPRVKNITRWIRGLTFVPADPANVVEFMSVELPERIFEHTSAHKQLEATSQHFCIHLKQALEVIGYNHPDSIVKAHAYCLYTDICFAHNHAPESEHAFVDRLCDRMWPEFKSPQTPEEAYYLIKKHNAFSDHDRRLMKGKA